MTHSNSFRCTMPPQALQNRKTSSPIRIDLLCLSFFRLRCSFRCRTPSTLPIASLLIFSSAVLCSLSELVYCTFGARSAATAVWLFAASAVWFKCAAVGIQQFRSFRRRLAKRASKVFVAILGSRRKRRLHPDRRHAVGMCLATHLPHVELSTTI